LSLKNCLLRSVKFFHCSGDFVFREDRLHGAHGLARPAVNALVRVDEELIGPLVDAVNRAHLNASLVLHVDARFSDHVRHLRGLLDNFGSSLLGRANHS